MLTRKRLTAKPRAGWDAIKQKAFLRARGQCEVILSRADWTILQARGLFLHVVPREAMTRCPDPARDCHHVVKRSQGGADDLNNCISICRVMHDLTDEAAFRGRLSIEPLGGQQFVSRVDVRPSRKSWGAATKGEA